MTSTHDLLATILGWLLVLGAALHGLGTWRQLDHRGTEFVWSLGAALAAAVVAFVNLLLLLRPGDALLALLAVVSALAWAAVAQGFGRAIGKPYDFRVIWHMVCGLGLAFLSATTLVSALL